MSTYAAKQPLRALTSVRCSSRVDDDVLEYRTFGSLAVFIDTGKHVGHDARRGVTILL